MKMDEFHDFEVYAESLQHLDLRVTLPQRKQCLWKLGQTNFKGMSLRRAYEGSGLIYEGAMQSDAHAILVVVKDPHMLTWNGQRMAANSVAVLKPGSAFTCASLGTNDWISFVVPREGLAVNGSELPAQMQAVRIVADPSNRVRTVLQRVAAAVEANPHFLNEAATVETVHAELLEMSRSLLKIPEPAAAPLHSGRPTLSRQKIIEIALNSITGNHSASVSVTNIAAAANLSERTLRSVFHEYFGVGPLRYMKVRQLTLARNDLRKADPACATVASIAAKHGIWELGKFAHEYSDLFGERPSKTLRSNYG